MKDPLVAVLNADVLCAGHQRAILQRQELIMHIAELRCDQPLNLRGRSNVGSTEVSALLISLQSLILQAA